MFRLVEDAWEIPGPCEYLTIWDLETGQKQYRNGKSFLCLQEDCEIEAWDFRTRTKRTLIRGNHYTPMFGLSPDEHYVVTDRMSENRNSYTRIWDITSGEKLTVLEDAGFVGFSPDGLCYSDQAQWPRHRTFAYFPALVGLLQELSGRSGYCTSLLISSLKNHTVDEMQTDSSEPKMFRPALFRFFPIRK